MKKFILSILSIVIPITVLLGEEKIPEFDSCYEYNAPHSSIALNERSPSPGTVFS